MTLNDILSYPWILRLKESLCLEEVVLALLLATTDLTPVMDKKIQGPLPTASFDARTINGYLPDTGAQRREQVASYSFILTLTVPSTA